jgi:hypothetical protein
VYLLEGTYLLMAKYDSFETTFWLEKLELVMMAIMGNLIRDSSFHSALRICRTRFRSVEIKATKQYGTNKDKYAALPRNRKIVFIISQQLEYFVIENGLLIVVVVSCEL